jgi:hypothetical protein
VLDGCGKQLQDLIQYSTNPDVMGRYGTIDEFLQDLDTVVDELTTPEPEAHCRSGGSPPRRAYRRRLHRHTQDGQGLIG